MPTPSDQSRERLLQAILERAATDAQFRAGLLSSPRATISATFRVTIPDEFRLRFIEKGDDLDALVVLPDLRPEGQLDVGDLDVVHGGAGLLPDGFETPW